MKHLKLSLIITAGILAVILACIFGVNSFKNNAISQEERVNSAMSDIKVYEKRRADLIPNLVDTIKAYDKHEYETLMAVVSARGSGDENIQEVVTQIKAVAEQYPELKSSDNYRELMNELSMTENYLAEYRSNYNQQVRNYQRYIRSFPANIFLSLTGYDPISVEYLDYGASSDTPTNLFD